MTVANIPVMARGWRELSAAGVSVLIFPGISKGYGIFLGAMEEYVEGTVFWPKNLNSEDGQLEANEGCCRQLE